MKKFAIAVAAATVALAGLAGSVRADSVELLQFTSINNDSDIQFDGSALVTGGATGDLQLSTVDTPPTYVNPLIGQDLSDPTVFHNTTMYLTGFAVSGAGTTDGTSVTQSLGAGTFAIYGPGGQLPQYLLLSGSATDATLSGSDGQAGVLSATVTYTGGLLLTAPEGSTGLFSFTLELAPGTTIHLANNGYVAPFEASASGDFAVNAVPTPSAVLGGSGLIGLVGLAQFRRRASAR
jgi:hypothetical protein